MKKLILILFLAVTLLGYSQEIDINYNKIVTLPTYTMDGDSTVVLRLTNDYMVTTQAVWAGLDQTDGSIKLQISMDGVNYTDYPIDSLLFNSAAGNGFIRNVDIGVIENYLRWNIDSGTCSAGTLKLYINLVTKD